MREELTLEGVVGDIDRLVGLHPSNVSKAGELWSKLNRKLRDLLGATEFDTARHRNLVELTSTSEAAAIRLCQSLLNLGRPGPTSLDWVRFSERDFIRLKDEVLALREFLIREAGFFRFACLRANLKACQISPEKLFNELHEQRAISERTWVLLMAQPKPWEKALKDRAVIEGLKRISSWFLDLQEVRKAHKLGLEREGSPL